MRYYATAISAYDKNRLQHFGIKGQKWGIRRFQNEDGSLTDAGKQRYGRDLREVEKNLDLAKMETAKYRRKVDRDNARILLPTLFPRHHKKQLKRANKKEAEIESVYENLKKHDEEQARKRFEGDEKLSSLSKRMDSFDKATPDEKIKLINDVEDAQTNIGREKGYGSSDFQVLNTWWLKNRSKAGEAKFKELDELPKGSDRDSKLTKLLEDSSKEGQDSIYADVLINRMQERHGDMLSRTGIKTKETKKILSDLDDLYGKEEEVVDRYYAEDRKRGIYPDSEYARSGYMHTEQLAKDHPEVKAAVNARESKWKEYCAQVLKEMDLPVNDKTIEYIEHVIIWH